MIANEQKLFGTLKQIGFTDFASAGIMANIIVESGFKPDNLQNSFEKRLGADAEYTKKVNERAYTREQFANDMMTLSKNAFDIVVEAGKTIASGGDAKEKKDSK